MFLDSDAWTSYSKKHRRNEFEMKTNLQQKVIGGRHFIKPCELELTSISSESEASALKSL